MTDRKAEAAEYLRDYAARKRAEGAETRAEQIEELARYLDTGSQHGGGSR